MINQLLEKTADGLLKSELIASKMICISEKEVNVNHPLPFHKCAVMQGDACCRLENLHSKKSLRSVGFVQDI